MFVDGEVGEDDVLLGADAHLVPELFEELLEGAPALGDVPDRGTQFADQDVDDRRLACPVRTQQHQDFIWEYIQ